MCGRLVLSEYPRTKKDRGLRIIWVGSVHLWDKMQRLNRQLCRHPWNLNTPALGGAVGS